MEIIMYSKEYCPYCVMAKELLEKKGQKVTVIDVQHNESKRNEMIEKTGKTTVPQIFINGKYIGGYDDLTTLEKNGELDKILN